MSRTVCLVSLSNALMNLKFSVQAPVPTGQTPGERYAQATKFRGKDLLVILYHKYPSKNSEKLIYFDNAIFKETYFLSIQAEFIQIQYLLKL